MTSGYNHGNLIKSIVLARGKLDKRRRNYRAKLSPAWPPATNFFIKAKKNRSYKGAPGENKRNRAWIPLVLPQLSWIRNYFPRLGPFLNYLVIKFFRKTTYALARFAHFFRCKSPGKCAARVMELFTHRHNDVLRHNFNNIRRRIYTCIPSLR